MGGVQAGPRRDPNAMDVDRGRGGDRTCYVCGKWGHMAKNCWERHKRRVVETPQELAKENGVQEVHKGLRQDSSPTTCASQEGAKIEMEKGTGGGI